MPIPFSRVATQYPGITHPVFERQSTALIDSDICRQTYEQTYAFYSPVDHSPPLACCAVPTANTPQGVVNPDSAPFPYFHVTALPNHVPPMTALIGKNWRDL